MFIPITSPIYSLNHLPLGLAISKRIFQLYGDDHQIYFLVDKNFAEKIQKTEPKIQCLIYSLPSQDAHKSEDESLVEAFTKFGEILRITDDRVKFVQKRGAALFHIYEEARKIYPEISKILAEIKPDCGW